MPLEPTDNLRAQVRTMQAAGCPACRSRVVVVRPAPDRADLTCIEPGCTWSAHLVGRDVADHAAGFGAGLTGVAIEAADKEFIAIERHGGRFAGGDDFSIEIDADGVGITGHGDVVPAEWLKAGPAHGQQPPIPGGGIAEFGVEGRALDADAG
jgi:hypothetical protein